MSLIEYLELLLSKADVSVVISSKRIQLCKI